MARRRAISYVTAILLITLMVVGIALGMAAYFNGWLSRPAASMHDSGGVLVIADGYLVDDAGIVKLYVANPSARVANVTSIYVRDGSGLEHYVPVNATIQPRSVAEIRGAAGFDVIPGREYLVRVYDAAGAVAAALVQAVNDPWLVVVRTGSEERFLDFASDGTYYYAGGVYLDPASGNYTFIVAALDPATKSLLWLKSLNPGASAGPGGVVYLDRLGLLAAVFAAPPAAYLALLDPASGALIAAWSLDPGFAVDAAAAYGSGDTVYAVLSGTAASRTAVVSVTIVWLLWWIWPAVNWATELSGVAWLPFITVSGNVYVAVNDTIVALSAADGSLVAATAVPFTVIALAADTSGVYVGGIGATSYIAKLSTSLSTVAWSLASTATSPEPVYQPGEIAVLPPNIVVYGTEPGLYLTTGEVVRPSRIAVVSLDAVSGSLVQATRIENLDTWSYSQKTGYTRGFGDIDAVFYELGNNFQGTLLWLNQTGLPDVTVVQYTPALAPATLTLRAPAVAVTATNVNMAVATLTVSDVAASLYIAAG